MYAFIGFDIAWSSKTKSGIGWAIIIDGVYDSSGVEQPDPELFVNTRKWIKGMIQDLQTGSLQNRHWVVVGTESVYLGPNKATFLKLIVAQTHIKAAASDVNAYRVMEISPQKAYTAITGDKGRQPKRKERKALILKAAAIIIKEKFGDAFDERDLTDDEADAIAISLALQIEFELLENSGK